MNIWNVSILILLTFISLTAVNGQSFNEDSNWFKEIGRYDDYYSRFDFRRYTESDVIKAKAKYLEIESDKNLDEWEGLYHKEAMLGHDELMWNALSGYVKTYTYHTLSSLDYGTAERIGLTISLRSIKSGKLGKAEELCFVKFGNTHFLVPQKSLSYFAEEAAGLFVDKTYDENKYYWVKFSERDEKVFGVPVFPKEFGHLVRQPISVIAEHFSKPKLHKQKSLDGTVAWEENRYVVTLSAGRNKGIRIGMSFYIDDLEERVEVTRVYENKSIAVLTRSVESDKETCMKYVQNDQVEFACRPTRARIAARTLSEVFFPEPTTNFPIDVR